MTTYTEISPSFWYLTTLLMVIALWNQGVNIARAYRSKQRERVKAAWLWGAVIVALSTFIYILVLHIVPSLLGEPVIGKLPATKLASESVLHKQILITIQDIVFLLLILLSPIIQLFKAIRSRRRLLIKNATCQLSIKVCLSILLYVIAYLCAPSMLFGPYC